MANKNNFQLKNLSNFATFSTNTGTKRRNNQGDMPSAPAAFFGFK